MTENKKWLSADELAERWERPLIDLYGFLRQGLPAYTDSGASVVDVKQCTSKPRFTKNQLRQMNPINQILLDWSGSLEAARIEEDKHEQWIDELYNATENWMMVGSKPNDIPMSFDSPRNHTEIDEAASNLRRLMFKVDDVRDFENTYPVQPPCIFRKEGDHWNIVYLGNKLSPSKPIKVNRGGKSFVWVHRLISLYVEHGNYPYDMEADQLENDITGVSIQDDDVGYMQSPEYDEDTVVSTKDRGIKAESNLSTGGKRYEQKADSEAIQAYKEKILKLQNLMKKYDEEGNEAKYDQTENEYNTLKSFLMKEYGRDLKKSESKSSETDEQREKARKRVSAHIHNCFEQIAKYDPKLSDHLRRCIKRTGTSFSYNPDRRIEWEV